MPLRLAGSLAVLLAIVPEDDGRIVSQQGIRSKAGNILPIMRLSGADVFPRVLDTARGNPMILLVCMVKSVAIFYHKIQNMSIFD